MVLFVAVTAVTYIIFFTIPSDPARLACGQRASQNCVRAAAAFIGTDRPVYVQYARFLDRLVVHHSLGRSFVNRRPVNDEVLAAAPVTASLVFGGMVLWLLIALPVGVSPVGCRFESESAMACAFLGSRPMATSAWA